MVFVTNNGMPLNSSQCGERFDSFSKKAGVNVTWRICPTKFRKTAATATKDAPIEEQQRTATLMDHSLETSRKCYR